jgi:hypothetical protein
VAAYFALNPLAGVAAVAIAAAVLAGANALANRSNVDTSGLGVSTGSIPFSSGFAPAVGELPDYVETRANGDIVNKLTGQVVGKAKGAAMAAASAATVTNSFNAATFRKAEEASMGTTINLTVTGAIDKEGTARTIVDTLNNSFYRGTGGATNLQIA